ncbi:hypothetical protein Trydic_g1160 [Trypoxylus dichotomus]
MMTVAVVVAAPAIRFEDGRISEAKLNSAIFMASTKIAATVYRSSIGRDEFPSKFLRVSRRNGFCEDARPLIPLQAALLMRRPKLCSADVLPSSLETSFSVPLPFVPILYRDYEQVPPLKTILA